MFTPLPKGYTENKVAVLSASQTGYLQVDIDEFVENTSYEEIEYSDVKHNEVDGYYYITIKYEVYTEFE